MALIRWTAVATAQKRPNHHLSQITIKRTAAQYSCGRGHGHGTVDTCAYFTINEDTGRTTIPPTNSSAEEERLGSLLGYLREMPARGSGSWKAPGAAPPEQPTGYTQKNSTF